MNHENEDCEHKSCWWISTKLVLKLTATQQVTPGILIQALMTNWI